LVAALFAEWGLSVETQFLPEKLEEAWPRVQERPPTGVDILLISGGASVGEHDATGELLKRLGFGTGFWGVRAKPGRPLLFATSGNRIAFGLPGNPLSHWACLHVFVRPAVSILSGQSASMGWMSGRLANGLEESAGPRDIFWPGTAAWSAEGWRLVALPWSNSGDVTCLAESNALLRIAAATPAGPMLAAIPFLLTASSPSPLTRQ
jgi:molybdopterin molybdotransferase